MLSLIQKIQNCSYCIDFLPAGPRPVVQLSSNSRILIIGQAPGRKVHETGIPWNDASGRTLRKWLAVDEETFYNPEIFSIMPMGFCYPGKGRSGDMPPRRECAPLWHSEIMRYFETRPLVLLIGQYAQSYYLKEVSRANLTETVKHFAEYFPEFFPLPHPSPRNQSWLKYNPWFADEVLPFLQQQVSEITRT
jgi:uracil-DNA glycosylase